MFHLNPSCEMCNRHHLLKQYEELLHERHMLTSFPSGEVYKKNETTNTFESVKYNDALDFLNEKIKDIKRKLNETENKHQDKEETCNTQS